MKIPTPKFLLRMLVGTAAVALSATALSACSSPAAEPASDAGNTRELIPITVGATPSIFSLAMHLGVNEGIFEEAGFDVEIMPNQSMSEGIPLLLQGTLQYIGGDMQNTILAASEGLPIVIAAPNSVGATEAPKDNIGFGGLLALETSDLKSIEDIDGATVGTNTIGGDAHMGFMQLAKDAGVDTTKINWVEIPGPQLVSSLRQGQVDAITVGEPNLTNAKLEGGVKVIASADAVLNGAPQFGWVTSQDWLSANPEAAKRFQEAVIVANQRVLDDRAAAEEALASYTELSDEVISNVFLPYYSTTPITPESLESTVDRMLEYKLISEADLPDLSALAPKL